MKHSFFFHVENIALPMELPQRLHIRLPTCCVSDMERVVREVWGFPECAKLQLWLGAPGTRGRHYLSDPEAVVEAGSDVWIRGQSTENPVLPTKNHELSTES